VNPARIDLVSFHGDQSPTAEVDHTPSRSMLKIRPFRFRGPTPGPQLSLGSAWSDEWDHVRIRICSVMLALFQ
jgi:hypothetical protein